MENERNVNLTHQTSEGKLALSLQNGSENLKQIHQKHFPADSSQKSLCRCIYFMEGSMTEPPVESILRTYR